MGAVSSGQPVEGVKIIPLKQFSDDRGMVMHMLRADQEHFKQFGEIYFSVVNPGVIKGWKKHKIMEQNFAVPVGEIKIVIYDDRHNSKTQGSIFEIDVGIDKYALIQIPPLVWYGFKGLSEEPAMIANCATIQHSPDESIQLPLNTNRIPYYWM